MLNLLLANHVTFLHCFDDAMLSCEYVSREVDSGVGPGAYGADDLELVHGRLGWLPNWTGE